jgi:pyrroloquinoline quinone biosynthesis protein B
MQVLALGSAAGGGFPQWNCACGNCYAVRAGTFHGKPRTQAQLAVSLDGNTWFLLGASPDLRAQIEAAPQLQPRGRLRQSPVAGVLLASAELDHVLGLLSLRELQPLEIHSTSSIRRILREDNSFFGMLNRVPGQVQWKDIVPGEHFWIPAGSGQNSCLRCHAVSLGAKYPSYVTQDRVRHLADQEALLGLILEAPDGKTLGYFPAVPDINDKLLGILESIDLLFFDGTFWSDDELIRVRGQGQTARQMGHVPVSLPGGSMELLAGLQRARKIFLHINNTNPMLDESGNEYRAVRAAGWEIAEDGWQFQL